MRWLFSKDVFIDSIRLLVGLAVGGVSLAHAESPSSLAAPSPTATEVAPWPRFHGPQGRGDVSQGQLPLTWQPNEYAWSFELGGSDVGSPVATDTTVFLLDSQTQKLKTNATTSSGTIDFVAIELATGKELWRHRHPFVDRKRHARNSPASTTPAIAGERVFFAYGDADGAYLYAYTLDGEPLWERQLGPWSGVHGFGASPMVTGDQVILFNSQQVDELESWQVAGQSRMMSFDVATGRDRWSTPLKSTRPCYGVPAIYEPHANGAKSQSHDAPQLVGANKGNGMFGMNSKTGELLWSLPVFDKRCCSSPLIVGDLAIASCGSGGGGNYISAVRIPQQPSESPEEVFRITRGAAYVPTSAVKDGLMFTVADNGIASCFDIANNGQARWSQRLGGNFGASPIIVGDQLLMVSLEGIAHVTTASDTKSEISEFDLGDRVGATPAFVGGRLLLRVGAKLHCLD